jgi:dipeptidyl aminopeptidase/acylaminoacyl peptidase
VTTSSHRPARRSFRPEDLYRFRIATEPRVSPDGRRAVFTVQTVAPTKDGYRHAVWMADLDGDAPAHRLTLGAKHDRAARFSPDGRTLAFLSDRRHLVEEEPDAGDPKSREDGQQIHLLPLDGGEARRLTDLPRGVDGFEWSPDGRRLLVTSSSHGPNRAEDHRLRGKTAPPKPGEPPESDYHFVDRLGYLFNGRGFVYHTVQQLWLVDAETGEARKLTSEPAGVGDAAWAPDGRRIVYATNLRRDHDLEPRAHLVALDVDAGTRTRLTGDAAILGSPVWLPDGTAVATTGGYLPENFYRNDIWLIAADGSDATAKRGGRNLTGPHDLMPGSALNSDIVPGEPVHLVVSDDGAWLTFTAPADGAMELFRVATADGRIERLTTGHHYIASFDQVPLGGGRTRTAWLRASATELSDLWVRDGTEGAARRVTDLNRESLEEVELREPVERWVSVEGRRIQGWYLPPTAANDDSANGTGARRGRGSDAASGLAPLVTEIHGGPHTMYGWSPMLEFQLLAANGMGVYFSNPRGSEGYGRDFNEANLRDWGPGPQRDVLAGIEALVGDGLADPARLGLTGGSYGGYLTNWILGHDDRFAAAMTCRSVSDMPLLFLTGDLSSGFWPRHEFGTVPWEDPAYYREISPITYADAIRTPLLIQHSEKDIRTTIGQAEELFTVLRSKRRPVRLLRVPEETHELTRSGTPFRRAENLKVVRDWFRHFLVEGKRALPPLPKVRAGR